MCKLPLQELIPDYGPFAVQNCLPLEYRIFQIQSLTMCKQSYQLCATDANLLHCLTLNLFLIIINYGE